MWRSRRPCPWPAGASTLASYQRVPTAARWLWGHLRWVPGAQDRTELEFWKTREVLSLARLRFRAESHLLHYLTHTKIRETRCRCVSGLSLSPDIGIFFLQQKWEKCQVSAAVADPESGLRAWDHWLPYETEAPLEPLPKKQHPEILTSARSSGRRPCSRDPGSRDPSRCHSQVGQQTRSCDSSLEISSCSTKLSFISF